MLKITAIGLAASLLFTGAPSDYEQGETLAGNNVITGQGGPWVHVDNRTKPTVCAGTLISPNKVLTAAHCFLGPNDNTYVRANNGSEMDWYAPSNVVSIESFDNTWGYKVKADIVLLTLSAPIPGTNPLPIINYDIYQRYFTSCDKGRKYCPNLTAEVYGQRIQGQPFDNGKSYSYGVGTVYFINDWADTGKIFVDTWSDKGDSGGGIVFQGKLAAVLSGGRVGATIDHVRGNHYIDKAVYDWLVARGVSAEPWENAGAKPEPEVLPGKKVTPSVQRIWGKDRVSTSIQVFDRTGSGENVVIATGRDYPDGLTGGVLAAEYGTSVILTMASGNQPLESKTLNWLKLRNSKHATIIGGTGAVPETVAQSLRNIGVSVERIAGANRFDTANQVMRKVLQVRGQNAPTKTYLVSGRNYPDALAAVPVVAKEKAVMVLAEGADPGLVAGNSVCVGGPACNAHPAASQVVGADRYDTAYRMAERMGCTHAGVAIGNNFADALSAGGYLSKKGACMLLTNGRQAKLTPQIKQVTLFGGPRILPDGIRYYTE